MLTVLLLVMAQPVPPTRAEAPLTVDFRLSPLLDKTGAAPGQKKLEEFDVSVQVEESRVFRIDDYALTLGDYEYDGWMQLTAWGAQPED